MFNCAFFTTHSTHLVEQHVHQPPFRSFIGVRPEVPFNDGFVNNESVLIEDGFKGVNDSIFFSNSCSDFFNINSLVCLLKMFAEQLANNTVAKVSFNDKLRYFILFTTF